MNLAGTGECAAFALRKAARAVTLLYDEALRGAGVRSTQFAILVAVAKKQPLSVGALAELTVIEPTTMTRSLALMAAQGLLQVSDRSTGRRKLVSLTERGRRQLARAVPLWRAAQKSLTARIGDEQWPLIQRKLERVTGHARRPPVARRT
jgi:DNA-binding MarR family transcriptional regulator